MKEAARSKQFLHAAAENIFPSYRKLANVQSAFDLNKQDKKCDIPVEVSSHLPLQILMTSSSWLYPIWVISTLNTLILKVCSNPNNPDQLWRRGLSSIHDYRSLASFLNLRATTSSIRISWKLAGIDSRFGWILASLSFSTVTNHDLLHYLPADFHSWILSTDGYCAQRRLCSLDRRADYFRIVCV